MLEFLIFPHKTTLIFFRKTAEFYFWCLDFGHFVSFTLIEIVKASNQTNGSLAQAGSKENGAKLQKDLQALLT